MGKSDDPSATRERLAALLPQVDGDLALARESAGTVELDKSAVGRRSRMDALQQTMAQASMQRLAAQRRRIVAAVDRSHVNPQR